MPNKPIPINKVSYISNAIIQAYQLTCYEFVLLKQIT